MTNEWGPPLTGEEMKAAKPKQRDIYLWSDPREGWIESYVTWEVASSLYVQWVGRFKLPANHPYYKVREYNLKHSTNLVLHDGSAKMPDDWDGQKTIEAHTETSYGTTGVGPKDWSKVIAYTPKPKESEVTEEMPRDEAIEYVLREYKYTMADLDEVKARRKAFAVPIELARLIQQYESDRLKPAVDVAAEEYAENLPPFRAHLAEKDFKAGAVWQKENGK